MILSLGFGTFIQQLIAYEVMSARDAVGLGNIPRSEEWVTLESTSMSQLSEMRRGHNTNSLTAFEPTLQMVAAIYNGVMSGGVPPTPPTCPSGNCTWPTTPSLAICGECEQKPYDLLRCYDTSFEDDAIYRQYSAADCCDKNDSYCDYSLPTGDTAVLYNAAKYSPLGGAPPGFHALMTTIAESDVREPFYHAGLFGLPYGAGRLRSPTPAYHECHLWTCIQYYNTSVRFGQHHQEVVEVNSKRGPSYPHGEEVWTPFGPLDDKVPADQQVNYAASAGALSAVERFVALNMYGSINVSSTDSGTYPNDLMRGVWNGTSDPNAWIQDVATSMTNVIRSNQTLWQKEEYNGEQFELAVKVRWLWIILPAMLVLSSIVFMVTVMIRTAHSPVRSWKGSPLTILLFDLDIAIRDVASERLQEHNGVEEVVGGQTVRLVRTSDGRQKFEAA